MIVSNKAAHKLLYVEGMFIKFSSLLVFFILLLLFMGHILNFCQRITGGTETQIEFEI